MKWRFVLVYPDLHPGRKFVTITMYTEGIDIIDAISNLSLKETDEISFIRSAEVVEEVKQQ